MKTSWVFLKVQMLSFLLIPAKIVLTLHNLSQLPKIHLIVAWGEVSINSYYGSRGQASSVKRAAKEKHWARKSCTREENLSWGVFYYESESLLCADVAGPCCWQTSFWCPGKRQGNLGCGWSGNTHPLGWPKRNFDSFDDVCSVSQADWLLLRLKGSNEGSFGHKHHLPFQHSRCCRCGSWLPVMAGE